MTAEEQAAQTWWLSLGDDQLKEVIVEAYRNHLKNVEERKELGFKWGIEL